MFRIYQQFAQIELHVDSLLVCLRNGKALQLRTPLCCLAAVGASARGNLFVSCDFPSTMGVCENCSFKINQCAVSRLLTTQKWFVPASGPNPFNQSHYLPFELLNSGEKFAHVDALSWEFNSMWRETICLLFFAVTKQRVFCTLISKFHANFVSSETKTIKLWLFPLLNKYVNKLCPITESNSPIYISHQRTFGGNSIQCGYLNAVHERGGDSN